MNGIETQLKGVKGWLLLLCICLTVLDPVAIFFNLMMATNIARPLFEEQPSLMRLMLVNGVCSIILILLSVHAGISLWRTHPRGVRYGKRYLVFASAYSLVSLYLPRLLGVPDQEQQTISAVSTLNTFITIVYMAAWYGYLTWSKRVALTFSDE
jgi:hypothetical protein